MADCAGLTHLQVVESLVAALSSSPARYRAWVVGVKVLCAAAAAAGIAHRAATLRELLRDASSATFLANVSPPAQVSVDHNSHNVLKPTTIVVLV